MEENDSYNTISKPSEVVLFKNKNSKFFGYAFPVNTQNDVKAYITDLKKEHYAARHWCYAYQLGAQNRTYRANDDGEPKNSAGMPIYGQIQSFNVTNILVVVVRYYGGVKLGVSGLINAYRTTAQMALKASIIVTKTINKTFQLQFDYKNLNKVMRILHEHDITIKHQKLELDCLLVISVRKRKSQLITHLFKAFYGVNINSI